MGYSDSLTASNSGLNLTMIQVNGDLLNHNLGSLSRLKVMVIEVSEEYMRNVRNPPETWRAAVC